MRNSTRQRLVSQRRPVILAVMLALLVSFLSAEVGWALTWASPEDLMATVETPDDTPKVAVTRLSGTATGMRGQRPGAGKTRRAWPGRGSAVSTTARTSVNGMNVTLTGTTGQTRIEVADQAGSDRAGVEGVLFGLATPHAAAGATAKTAAAAAGPVTVAVDVSAFADAIGGDWASRARLVYLPGCDATSVGTGCARAAATPLQDSASDGTTVTGVLPTQAVSAMSSGIATMAVTADASGPSGSFAATPLSPSSAWSAGSGTGEFSWQYPVEVPDAEAGPAPEVTITYNSAAVDGRTSSTNNQASWVGDGFDLNLGYVERRYVSCADDTAAVGGATPNNTSRKTGDQCWGPNAVTLALDGHTTDLVKDTASGGWIPKDDDNTRVQLLTGAGNGDNDGEYWQVTTEDGTRYFFGRQTRGSGDTAALNSTQTVPVYGNHPGEPCYASTFSTAWCQQAYRWNLSYVVDVHGNSMSFFYDKETNYYNRNLGSTANTGTATGTGQITGYERGATLNRVEYGTRDGVWTGKAPYQVTFSTAERCIPSGSFTCDPALLTAANAAQWPDVPFDQICTATTCAGKYSPTFFTRKRLTSIATRAVTGAGADRLIDSYALTQSMADPGDGTSKALWLDSIARTGKAATPAITLPAVTFTGVAMDNRVDAVGDEAPPLRRWRVTGVSSGNGSTVAVSYSPQDCTPTSKPAAPESNIRRCFPVYYLAPGASDPKLHYFHKYLVSAVTENDNTGGSPAQTTSYDYVGDPAWHYDDNVLTPAKYRTWGDWRGYGQVITRVGSGSDPKLKSSVLFMRGMHGDKLPTGTRTVTVTDSQGGTLTDQAPLAGFPRESVTYLGDTATIATSAITTPWISAATGTDTTVTPALTAVRVDDAQITTRVKVSTGYRTTRTTTSYDSYGRDTQVWDEGDLATTTDDICTTSTYTQNTTAWILDTPATSMSVAKPCGVSPTFPADLVTATQNYYDGATTLTAAPSKGEVTRETEADTYTAGAWTYTTASTTAYDALGRPTTTTDALGRSTTTAYTPTGAVPSTSVATTSPGALTTTTTLDPGVGPLTSTDPNGATATVAYDALGRVVKVWEPGRATTATANAQFTYTISTTTPNAVTTKTLTSSGAYTTSATLYDGLLRPRQTQTPVSSDAGGGRLITTTDYDTRGLTPQVIGPFTATGSPSTTLVTPATLGTVPTIHAYTYDGLGRATLDTLKVNNTPKWSTATAYTGDTTTVTPPAGGTVTTSVVDALGRTTALRQHTGPTGASSYDETVYTYTPGGQAKTITDPAGNTWAYSYDVHGRLTSSTDPDRGTTTTTYDAADQVTTTTDGRGQILWHGYDSLGRQTQLRQNSSTGTQLAAWTYDTATLGKGRAATATRYSAGNAYTRAITGYTPTGEPTGSSTTIPAAEGALAGTYTTAASYTISGMVSQYTPVTAPGLPTDVQKPIYNTLDDQLGLDTVDHGAIVPGLTLDAYGNTTQVVLGNTTGKLTTLNYGYETGTNRLVSTQVARQTAAGAFDADIAYAYNDAGAITSITDTAAGTGGDKQCFTYDYLQRLTQSWAQTGTSGAPACAAAPSQAVLGGSAPYWTTYAYDKTGNRTGETRHATTAAGADTVRSYTYRNPSGAGANTGPHQLASLTETGPAGTRTDTTSYDNAGNTTTQTTTAGTQTFTWDTENQLTTVTGPGASSYLYDADGTRLIRRDPTNGTTTLYLGDTEIALATATGVKTSTRYYTLAGAQVAVRTASDLTSVVTDPHNSGTYEINNATGALTAARRLDPFGNNRATTTGTWQGSKGFVGGTIDPTGLTQLGARAYNPTTGRFISLDPILNPLDPQQLNGYAYANNNPINQTDPDGLFTNPFKAAWNKYQAAKAAALAKWRAIQRAIAARLAAIRAAIARAKAAAAAARAKLAAAAARAKTAATRRVKTTIQAAKTKHAAAVADSKKKSAANAAKAGVSKKTYVPAGGGMPAHYTSGWGTSGIQYTGNILSNRPPPKDGDFEVEAGKFVFESLILAPVGGPVTSGALRVSRLGIGAVRALATGTKAGKVAKTTAQAESGLAKAAAKACSFAGETLVLMGDGSKRSISQIRPGDMVLATDPEAGVQGVKSVERVFVHRDALSVLQFADGSTVATTQDHPYWSIDDGRFERAEDLGAGEEVLSADGRHVRVSGFREKTIRWGAAYNLSIQGIHTYHVGSAAVLVHNTCDMDVDGLEHVIARHTAGGAEVDASAGIFDDGLDLAVLARGSAGQIGNRNTVTGNIEYVIKAKQIVGVTGSRRTTSTYKVIRNPYGELVTMYPIG